MPIILLIFITAERSQRYFYHILKSFDVVRLEKAEYDWG